MKAITKRQEVVLEAIRAFTLRCGYPPTLRDLSEATGIKSTNGISDHLDRLERAGRLKRSPLTARSLVVLGDPDIGPRGAYLWPMGSPRAAAHMLLGNVLRVTGPASASRVATVLALAADPTILEAYLPTTLAHRWTQACLSTPALEEADREWAARSLVHGGALVIDEETSRWLPGRALSSLPAPEWAAGRARVAGWALDSIPTLAVILRAA